MIAAALAVLLAAPAADDDGARPLVPAAWIVARDPRPLMEQKRRLIDEALDLETEALRRQADLPFARPENIAADLRRIAAMRALLDRPIDPDRISPRALSLLDRYLVGFALDRLAREGADASAVAEWTDANRAYAATGDLGARETALKARARVLAGMTGGALLRRFLIAVEDGTLDVASRREFVEGMRREFPGATLPTPTGDAGLPFVPASASPLPLGGAAAGGGGGANPFRDLRPFPRQPGSESLPRLDGVQRPLGEVSSLAELLAKMQGGGS